MLNRSQVTSLALPITLFACATLAIGVACGGAKKAKLADSPGGTLGGFGGSQSNQAPTQCEDGAGAQTLTSEELNECGTCIDTKTGPLPGAFDACTSIAKDTCPGLFTPDTSLGEPTPATSASCCSLLLDCFSNIYRTSGGVPPTAEQIAARAESCRTRAGTQELLSAFTHVYKTAQTACGTVCKIPETAVASTGCPAFAAKNPSCDGCRCVYGFNSNGTECISTFCGAGKQPKQDSSTPPKWTCSSI